MTNRRNLPPINPVDQRQELFNQLLLVEHNMALVMEVSHRVVVLNFGRKIAEGTPDEVRNSTDVIEAYLGKPTA
jgi:branched-chain amino acid transport system ATP-binding protein